MANKHGRKTNESKSGRAGIKKQRRDIAELKDEYWIDDIPEQGRGRRWVVKLNNPSQKFVTRLLTEHNYRRMVERRVGALSNSKLTKKLNMLIKYGQAYLSELGDLRAKIYSKIDENN